MTITAELLSGSTDGEPISVVGTTSGAADTIHTAHASAKDEIWIWAANEHTADVVLTIEFGNATEPVIVTVPSKDGAHLVIPGARLTNSKVVKAFADVTAVVSLFGNVNRHA